MSRYAGREEGKWCPVVTATCRTAPNALPGMKSRAARSAGTQCSTYPTAAKTRAASRAHSNASEPSERDIQGFFDQHMAPGLDRPARHCNVERRRGRDHDGSGPVSF